MKKIINIILIFAILASYFIPVNFEVYAANTYRVSTIDTNGNEVVINTFDNYNDARNAMNSYNSTVSKVAVVFKNDVLVNAKYGIVRMTTSSNTNTYIYANSNRTGYLTYFNGSYSTEVLLLDYSDTYNSYKIKVAGVVGWISATTGKAMPISRVVPTNYDAGKNYIQVIATTPLNVRKGPGLSYEQYGCDTGVNTCGSSGEQVSQNQIYEWLNKGSVTTSDGFEWYKIKYPNSSGYEGYIAHDPNDPYVRIYAPTGTMDTYYYVDSSKQLKHQFYASVIPGVSSTTLGKSPLYLQEGIKYYSFDGNYFYTSFKDMVDNELTNSRNKAINKTPYYNYYQYLPYRTQTNYSAQDIDDYLGYSAKIDRSLYYQYNNTTEDWEWIGPDCNTYNSCFPANQSMLYNEGANFKSSETNFGANALLTLGLSINESAWGRSWIAVKKYNLFGHGAYDYDPGTNANTYASPASSINYHASKYVSYGYANPSDSRHYGSHFGNKLSGMNVAYASDAYWAEKMAANYYSFDKQNNLFLDFKSYKIGIKQIPDSVVVQTEPTMDSTTLYSLKNVASIPVVILDTVEGQTINDNNIWYKIQSDVNIDSNRVKNVVSAGDYNFETSYAYVHSSYFYVEEEKPVITAPNKRVVLATSFNPKSGVTAYDAWDGNLTSSIEVISNNVNIDEIGTYQVDYKVTDSDGNIGTKQITVEVYDNGPTDTPPVINNASNIVITQGDSLDLKSKVSALDQEDGDLTSEIVVTPSTLDTTQTGIFDVTYSVTDYDGNEVSKTIKVTINQKESINYTSVKGSFGLHSLGWNDTTNTVDVKGYLTMLGINNSSTTEITYDMILVDSDTKREYVKSLSRWTTKSEWPFTVPSSGGYDYSYSWFEGNLDLSDLPEGEYRIYIRARSGNKETKQLFRNIFFKEIDQKISVDSAGRGYEFKNNYFDNNVPLELFITNQGLVTTKELPTVDNMLNPLYKIGFDGNYLNIYGVSHNVKGNYSKSTAVERQIILQNLTTFQRHIYNVGYVDNGDYKVTLSVSDGYDKTRAWYNAHLNISNLSKGTYAIFIRTKTSNVDDIGELYDIFYKDLTKYKTTIGNKKISLRRVDSKRFRIELVIE